MPNHHDFVGNELQELLAQMDYDNDSPTNRAPPPPELEDSALQHDMDNRHQARRALDLATGDVIPISGLEVHRSSSRCRWTGLDETLGCDQVDRTLPAGAREHCRCTIVRNWKVANSCRRKGRRREGKHNCWWETLIKMMARPHCTETLCLALSHIA